MRAIHPGGQVRPYLDKVIVLSVFLQPCAPRPVRAGLQPRELHASLRSSKRGFSLVSVQRTAQADKDRSQDYQSLQDDRIPDGRGRGAGEAVPVDAIQDTSPGQGMREGAGLKFVNSIDEIRRPKTRGNYHRTTGRHKTWR